MTARTNATLGRGGDADFTRVRTLFKDANLPAQVLLESCFPQVEYATAHGHDVVADELERSGARRLTLGRPG